MTVVTVNKRILNVGQVKGEVKGLFSVPQQNFRISYKFIQRRVDWRKEQPVRVNYRS